jgi:glutamate-ammonia-ligase adenylyltransferase
MQQTVFLDSIRHLPSASAQESQERLERLWEEHPTLHVAASAQPKLMEILSVLASYSPYLLGLVHQHIEWFTLICETGVDAAYETMRAQMRAEPIITEEADALMQSIRNYKTRTALLLGLADISEQWPLEKITQALSDMADWTLDRCCNHLLWLGHSRGEIALKHPEHPVRESGLIVFGMGKLGAGELNYSSDIDIILFYERQMMEYTGRHDIQRFYSRLALELVRLMQERTRDGYVFRTDLRLRPDPFSTPPAISTAGAITYYETVGQNWERAAMIKARPVAGDIAAGERFLKELRPFIWRKYLDYPAINDILSIKRQMHARAGQVPNLLGHNVKTGTGGIREIEFFAQVHQLIWGGRVGSLRSRGTCETLRLMVQAKLLEADQCEKLISAYGFLRMVEHRLQMVDDQQTHKLPDTDEGLAHIAQFCGFDSAASFSISLHEAMQFVHQNFAGAFSEREALSSDEGNLVFTGVDPDEDTLKTLHGFGFTEPELVWNSIAAWHRGSRRATRTKRARELITEITPALLKAIGQAADSKLAFQRLDEFVSRLPAGVQLFALLQAQPHLIELLARVLGGAPALAEALSRQPSLFDVVLSGDVYARTQEEHSGSAGDWLHAMMSQARTPDEQWQQLVRFRQEQEFWAGMRVLRSQITPLQSLPMLSDVAERVLQELVLLTEAEFTRDYGRIPGGEFAVLAMGRLGSREVCFGSDLDLVFVYDVPDTDARSDGPRSFDATVYYNRFAQRIIGLLDAQGPFGKLYAIDTRLRPSGKDGHLAVQRQGLLNYFQQSAWTFEYLALCRARSVAGSKKLCAQLDTDVKSLLMQPIIPAKLMVDVKDLRGRITHEFPPKSEWDVKYANGGLLELDFLIQSLALIHTNDALPAASISLLPALVAAEALTDLQAEILYTSYCLQLEVQALLRLSQTTARMPPSAGVQRLLTQILPLPEGEDLGMLLTEQLAKAHQIFLQFMPEDAQTATE